MKPIYFLLIILAFSPCLAHAQEFRTYSIELDVAGKTVHHAVEVTFSNLSELTYVVERDIEDVSVSSRNGEVVYSHEKDVNSRIVISDLSGKEHIKIKFSSASPLLERGDETEVLFKLRSPIDVERFSLRVALPENTLPTSTRDGYSTFPTPDKQFIGDGRYHIIWERMNLEAGDELIFYIDYSTPKKSYLPYLLSVLILLGALLVVYQMQRRKREMLFRGLSRDEREVVEFMLAGKERYQHEIQKELGLSKVKMTRVMQKLEEKGLIAKEKHGKRNKLFLKI